MGKQSGYLKRKNAEIGVYRQAEKETYIQFMTDTLIITLNDPEVMGKDVFGKKRIEAVVRAWGKTYDKFHEALEKSKEADCVQDKLDERIRKVIGEEDFHPFSERYEWVKKQVY